MSPHQLTNRPNTGGPIRSGGRKGSGGAFIATISSPSSSRGVGCEVPEEPQHGVRLLERPEDRSTEDHRAGRMQVVVECGNDAEVPAAATKSPPQVVMRVVPRAHEITVGGDHLGATEVVDAEPVLAHQMAEAAGQRDAGDAGAADRAAGRGQPEALRREVELSPAQPG